MDYSTSPSVPPIPRQARHHPRRREGREDRDRSTSHDVVSPASPEVISSLITSLSVISRPASQHFDLPIGSALTIPASPRSPTSGSFGVDYGAFSQRSLDQLREEDADINELAASPPVIRTAKPPSGFSPLTAPKSPSSKEGGLKSILSGRSSASRPSSKGSLASRDADTQSIGNLSIERGNGPGSPAPELRRQRSHDSWGKKTGRSHKGLMYMSSKERLREKELEKKRASAGAVGSNQTGLAASLSRATSPRPDPFLAETPITEEPSPHGDSPTMLQERPSSVIDGPASSPRPIPTRDSSLRKTGSSAKRSSARASRSSKRESDPGSHAAIPETDEFYGSTPRTGHQSDTSRRRHQSRNDGQQSEAKKMTVDRSRSDGARSPAPMRTQEATSTYLATDTELDVEDGAPFPAVAQGRRRDRDSSNDRSGRRRSGRQTPEPLEGMIKPKRSSSRLKRLSGPLSPRGDERTSISARETPEPTNNVGYERPRSADSIDDAVESYLCSPRLSQKIKHPQTGRVISFSEVGDSEGSAVFCCVGMGLTRYITAFYDELALTLKLRLITPDRPGVGDSEAYADGTATPLSWPDDVYAICQALKITKFSILAHSAGAIYALATALRMPQHIRGRIHLLAPWIPPSQMSVFGASAQTPLPPTNAIPTSQRILRALPTPILKAANSSFMTATSSSITSSLPKTPRRNRKKGGGGRDRDSTATKGNGRTTPSGIDNKENHQGGKATADAAPIPANDLNATEEMDRIRPDGTSPTGTSPLGSAVSQAKNGYGIGGNGGASKGHRKTASSASAAHARQEAAILAAAADALADKERQMTYDTRLTHAIWDLATTGANPAVDLLVCLERRHTIGFRYVDITRPVVIHHGSRDTRVPVENVKWLGKTMRRCEVRVLEGEGHGLMASATVMGGVLMEISREWEDWARATGAGGHNRGRDGERRKGALGAR
ncbi:Alpha beta hydrolase fold family [Pleurostoma richardsiae]|uniref:Alpha beta hydrolase fold family n=1 Tax=Pleurostoma richardsiae TaxID=41990 RepID=A0AA38S1V7_9PEZI|nr:Alpha beta hydrolase fold family [Pleurostoma richardsiae]